MTHVEMKMLRGVCVCKSVCAEQKHASSTSEQQQAQAYLPRRLVRHVASSARLVPRISPRTGRPLSLSLIQVIVSLRALVTEPYALKKSRCKAEFDLGEKTRTRRNMVSTCEKAAREKAYGIELHSGCL